MNVEASSPRAARSPQASAEPLVIVPSGGWPRIDFRELATYRELFYFLVWRDIKVRYAQTVLGAAWAVLQPVIAMVVFTVVFGRFAKIPSDGVPYPIFSFAAMVPWTYFSNALSTSSQSLVANPSLVTKIYFPRLVIPMAPVISGLLNFGISFVILLLMMLAFGISPGPWTLLIPLLLLILMMTAAGAGCWLAALNIQYRDVRHIVPFLIQIWMYVSPVVYPMSIVPEQHRSLYALNPVAPVIEGFRSILLGTNPIPWDLLGVATGSAALLLVTGVLYFRHTERVFADVA